MENMFDVLAFICSIAVWVRFKKYLSPPRTFTSKRIDNVRVSIIIPVRDEASNIGSLLNALLQLEDAPHEIIVVDDNSKDHTYQLAESYGVRVVRAGKKPEGWAGKTWACHVGAEHATGDLLLFTDADTRHHPYALRHAVSFLSHHQAEMMSCPSFHHNKFWWEKLLGPFHCLIHAGASPYDRQSTKSPYALGQYILIKRNVYDEIGGFEAISHEIAEDAALARRAMEKGKRYVMYQGAPLFTVQMYASFAAFFSGWMRMMRIGMQQLSGEVILNTFVPLFALNLWNITSGRSWSWLPALITLVCFAVVQRRIGNFSVLGIILFPISLLLFLMIGICSTIAQVFDFPIEWRGRTYRLSRRMYV